MSRPASTIEPEPRQSEVLRRRAEAEYMEMPGLKLTAAQASRLWHLDATASASLLESMVDAGVLYRTKDGAYLLLAAPRPRTSMGSTALTVSPSGSDE